MNVKKLGKVVLHLNEGAWSVEGHNERYKVNERLVELHPEVKAINSQLGKAVRTPRPPVRKPLKREVHLAAEAEYRKQMRDTLLRVYEEIKQDSFSYPIPMRKEKDFEHNSDYRYCMFKGIIYRFDRPGYEDKEIIRSIEKLEGGAHGAVTKAEEAT
jgi:hypothetical protein